MMLIRHKVLVLQRRRMRCTILHQATERTALQIVNACNVIFIIESQRVAHQDQMHLIIVLHFHCIDAIDARNQRIRVLFQMLVELGQDLLQQDDFIICHCLHNEASVVTEEEETATGSSSFTCFEDLVTI